eukprot:3060837-Prymnesium_polylepis.1
MASFSNSCRAKRHRCEAEGRCARKRKGTDRTQKYRRAPCADECAGAPPTPYDFNGPLGGQTKHLSSCTP